MTPQEIFNKVATHLLKQNCQAREGEHAGQCLYYGPNDTKCAVGCLIDKAHYHTGIEGGSIVSLRGFFEYPDDDNRGSNTKSLLKALEGSLGMRGPEIPWGLLRDLQGIHDSHFKKDWPSCLENCARNHGLRMPELAC
jgi:hypothetical protein